MSSKKASKVVHVDEDGKLFCNRPKSKNTKSVTLSKLAQVTCIACLNSAKHRLKCSIGAWQSMLETSNTRLAELQQVKRRYQVSTHNTASTYCYVLATSEEEAISLAFSDCAVEPSTLGPGDDGEELNTWYVCEIDGDPVEDSNVEAVLVEKAGAA